MNKQKTQAERWADMLKEFDSENQTLKDCVKSLFEILDSREETGPEAREFSPTYISSCRLEHSAKLGILLPKMKELANG